MNIESEIKAIVDEGTAKEQRMWALEDRMEILWDYRHHDDIWDEIVAIREEVAVLRWELNDLYEQYEELQEWVREN